MRSKLSFNLAYFAQSNGVSPTALSEWMIKHGFPGDLNATAFTSKKGLRKMVDCARRGVAVLTISPNTGNSEVAEIRRDIKKLEQERQGYQNLLHTLREKCSKFQISINERQLAASQLSIVNSELQQIRQRYAVRNAISLLKLDTFYKVKLQEQQRLEAIDTNPDIIAQLLEELQAQKSEILENKKRLNEIINRIKELQTRIAVFKYDQKRKSESKTAATATKISPKEARRHVVPPITALVAPTPKPAVPLPLSHDITKDGETVHHVLWQQITFGDGYIIVKVGTRVYDRYRVQNARRSLNDIKDLYDFRKTPPLEIVTTGNRVLRIFNEELLFHYLAFFSFAGSFDKSLLQRPVFKLSEFQRYSKKFYQKYLPQTFKPRFFRFLCEYAIDDFPIIPVPEIVINTSGSTKLHDSFLFPIRSSGTVTLVWESIEDAKASYIFQIRASEFELHLQCIYDYLTGDTVNKRQTLVNNQNVKESLGLQRRIFHTDPANWESEIRQHSKKGRNRIT